MLPPRLRSFSLKDKIVLVTGGHGLLGNAIRRELDTMGADAVLAPKRTELDLLDTYQTAMFFKNHRPNVVFHLASVGFGLLGNLNNQFRAITDATIVNHNVLVACAENKVDKIFVAGSVAAYPFPYKSIPLAEHSYWEGLPHPSEIGYAHAKRHALAYLEIMSESLGIDFFYGILTNLYGPEDRFDQNHGHVIPSLIRKMYQTKSSGQPFRVWGDGSARRDFMHAQDAARAVIHGMTSLTGSLNISSGKTVSIRYIVEALVEAAGFDGQVVWEADKPVGVPERSVSNSILESSGFECVHDLRAGIKETWQWFVANAEFARL